jgi:hypothetical protein
VTIRKYKAECLIGLGQLDEAEVIIMKNLRLHGNNVVARILQLNVLVMIDEWIDVRRLGFEAEDIIPRMIAPEGRIYESSGIQDDAK